MERIFVVIRPDLHMSLMVAILSSKGTSLSFGVEVTLVIKGKTQEGKLILSERSLLWHDPEKTVLSVVGTVVIDGKSFFFNGIYEREGDHESCCLLVLNSKVFEINVSKEEFVSLAKKYCEGADIPLREDGSITDDVFPFFVPASRGAGAPSGTLRSKGLDGVEISTILLRGFFPVLDHGEACFGRFIGDHKIRIYTKEEMSLTVTDTVHAL